MSPETAQIALTLVFVMFLFLGSGLWIALSLLGVGWVGLTFFSSVPVEKSMATSIWQTNASWTLAALPLFIWMGEILFRAKLSEILFRGLTPWLGWLPGRLLHVNVVGCGIFAAVCGSSAATAATIGRMSLPELLARGYDRRISIGSLAGSGTLGLLIPPSIIMIVYGVSADVSIVRLFLAGVFPGLMVMALFSGVHCRFGVIPKRYRACESGKNYPDGKTALLEGAAPGCRIDRGGYRIHLFGNCDGDRSRSRRRNRCFDSFICYKVAQLEHVPRELASR